MKIFIEFCYKEIKQDLLKAVLGQFDRDRNGTNVDKYKLGRVIKCYVDMGMNNTMAQKTPDGFVWLGVKNLTFYTAELEEPLLRRTRDEYNSKALKWIGENTAPAYLTLCDTAFSHEENYCATLFQPETKAKLMHVVEQQLISNQRQIIVDKETGCKYMIENKRVDELRLMYKCFVR
jgi:cullin 3